MTEIRNLKSQTNSKLQIRMFQTMVMRGLGLWLSMTWRSVRLSLPSARAFVKQLPRTICNQEDVRQLVNASGSQGANYLEANNALSKKEFRLRIRIARKETRESYYWLRLLDTQGQPPLEKERHELLREAEELAKIFGAILRNSE